MSVTARSKRRSLAFITALATFFALVVPLMAQPVEAQTPSPGVLQVTPETDQNPTGSSHELTATITQSGLTNGATVEVDFEIDCTTSCGDAAGQYVIGAGSPAGGPVVAPDAPVEGNQTPGTQDDSRTSPEMSCTITISGASPSTSPASGTGTCTVSYQRFDSGDDEIAAWIDTDNNNATDNSDQTEARDEATGPGNTGEPDGTDVVAKNWFAQGATGIIVDCDDQSGNDNNNVDSSDRQVNQPGETETYTCKATKPDGPDQGNERDPATGIVIDAEHEGANDPDNRGFNDSVNTTADYNDACTTDSTGTCTFNLVPAEGEVGEAEVCFWHDADNDNTFDGNDDDSTGGTDEADGEECGDEDWDEGETDTTWGAGGGDDSTDVVLKIWGASDELHLDARPEYDQNNQGTSHTVTATVRDDFGNPVAGVPVDFEINGGSRNDSSNQGTGSDRLLCDNKTTNSSGEVSCTYTDVGTGTNPIIPGQYEVDEIDVCIDSPPTTGDDCTTGEDTDDDPFAQTEGDRVEKFWFNQTPTATSLFIDMDPDGSSDCGDGSPGNNYDQTATNSVNSGHTFCVEVFDQNGNPDPGEEVTVSLSGPGEFWLDLDDDDEFDENEGLGKSVKVNTDEDGQVYLRIYSDQSGTTTITATAENASDTGQKIWTTQPARVIDCDPETATNDLGQVHTVSCDVTDRDGNPVEGVRLQAIEDGAGQFINCPEAETDDHYGVQRAVCDNATDAAGNAIFQTQSQTQGTQTIEVAIECDASDGQFFASTCDSDTSARQGAPSDTDNECDARANERHPGEEGEDGTDGVGSDPGAPAGACFDQVTKTWEDQPDPQAECEDGIDNDGDGNVDQGDAGCLDQNGNYNPNDDDESDEGDVVTSGPCQGYAQGSSNPDPAISGRVIVGTPGSDLLTGTSGDDVICGLGGNDVIEGGSGADLIVGNSGDDTIEGGGGKDSIRGGSGNDAVDGDRKNDVIAGGSGDDTLRGNGGFDTLRGGSGKDTLQGGNGDDILRGGGDNDTLKGFRGDDILNGGKGTDTCKPGTGNDKVKNCEK